MSERRNKDFGMKLLALVFAAITASSSANAEWVIHSSKDRMTDKTMKYATLSAKAMDQNISATLELSCNEDNTRSFAIRLSKPMTRGRISARLRADDLKVRPMSALHVFSDPYRISIITAPNYDLWGRKRFRAELFPSGSTSLFYDFDLTGLAKTISSLPCNAAPDETFEDTGN